MGLFDELSDLAGKAVEAASQHPDQVKAALAKAEEAIDGATGHQFTSQVQQGATMAEGFLESKAPHPSTPAGTEAPTESGAPAASAAPASAAPASAAPVEDTPVEDTPVEDAPVDPAK